MHKNLQKQFSNRKDRFYINSDFFLKDKLILVDIFYGGFGYLDNEMDAATKVVNIYMHYD